MMTIAERLLSLLLLFKEKKNEFCAIERCIFLCYYYNLIILSKLYVHTSMRVCIVSINVKVTDDDEEGVFNLFSLRNR